MNRSQGNLQDAFLNSARRESIGVTIYLVSGVQLRGVIRAFDAFTLLLESQGRPPQMVYKHSIASVAPVRPVPMDTGARSDQAEVSAAVTTDESDNAPGAADPATEAASPVEPPELAELPESAERELPVSP